MTPEQNTSQEPTRLCTVCSRIMKASEAHSIKGRSYCSECLVEGAQLAGIAKNADMVNYSPERAVVFALIPGMGAVYNRQYPRAVLHFSVFAGLILMSESRPEIFVLATIAWYVFTIFDAYRSAQSIIRDRIHDPEAAGGRNSINVPIWGGVLVLFGGLLFLDNIRWLRLRYFVDDAWPLLFVAAGAYLIYDFYNRPKAKAGPAAKNASPGYTPEPPSPPNRDIGSAEPGEESN